MATVPEKIDQPATLPNSVIQFTPEEALLNQYVSEAQYWEKYYESSDVGFEWNNGRLEKIPMTSLAEYQTFVWFNDLLKDYLFGHPIAQMVGLEMGFRLVLSSKITIRKPDLGLVLNSNPIPLGNRDRSYAGVFDITIESLSAGSDLDIFRDAVTKREEYAQGGVQEYYLLDERGVETQFLSLSPTGIYLEIPCVDGIIRSSVLPGFQLRLKDLYLRPRPGQMLNDPIYKEFISPELRAERVRAEAAEELAEQEKARAEQEKARAEQEKARAEQEKARAIAAEKLAAEYASRLRSLEGRPPESSKGD